MQAPESYNLTQVMDLINPAPATHRTRPSEANGTWYRRSPSPASLRSAPSPAMRERGHKAHITKPLSRTAGEGGPSPKGWVGEGANEIFCLVAAYSTQIHAGGRPPSEIVKAHSKVRGSKK
jgi:hypothetical protein